jgi:hypothetical protein
MKSGDDGNRKESQGVTAGMTAAEIQDARTRLRQMAKEGPSGGVCEKRGSGIVRELYPEIAALRAVGWRWSEIQKQIGPKIAGLKPETLERYFELVKKSKIGGKAPPKVRAGAAQRKAAMVTASADAGNGGTGRDASPEKKRARYNPDVVDP